ncbi:hypothetical protein TraAM80_03404 [Trypanosoma rangeli]|uniref:Uncharacterized protein n=1 Tax=Trypanosoma rangeli TaxID=5698 RepID=A0A422NPC0_TRYRA|nr:uncharacterized protein TraAM80_03404 [Trypanosoma rangeli]RNF07281.1 hypothetical protein TraAM80_03404 [Trypanosoma rangeli]|eukprot:RNF07281.1 hypothetical protein TraAM80_03404 [Trypanosoma rangeli]
MNRLNVNEATREELLEVVKQLRQQLRQHQTSSERAKELKRQVDQLKQELCEKESAVRALGQQNVMLSEKSAADEETIGVLIKQLEDMNVGMTDTTGSDGVVEARAVPAKAAAARVGQASVKGSDGTSLAGSAGGEFSTPPNAAAIIAQQNEEMAKLEMKVRELTEVNTFYTAIVSHHDEEERLRAAQKDMFVATKLNAAASADITPFHDRIVALENERDSLQRVVRQQNQEKQALMSELQEHCEELSRLELDLVAAERWKVSAEASSETVASIPPVYTFSSLPDEEFPSLRTSGQLAESMQYKGRHGGSVPSPATRPRSTGSSADTHAPARGLAGSRGLPPPDALPEIRLRNPSKQEKLLLERVELYWKCIEEMQEFEVDRQRGFDRIEHARAELFTEMNTKLEEQRREIQRLNKRLAASAGTCGGEDERRTTEPRSVRDALTSPIVFSGYEGEHAKMPSFNARPEASTGVGGALSEEGGDDGINAGWKAPGGDYGVTVADASMGERAMLECLGSAGVLAKAPALKKNEAEMEAEETDTEFGGDERIVCKAGGPAEAETRQWREMRDSPLPKVDWERQLLAKEEGIGRLGILREEGDAAVHMLLLSRAAIAAAATAGFTAHDKGSPDGVEALQTALDKMRGLVSSLEGREQELLAEVARLQKEMTPVLQVAGYKNNPTATQKTIPSSPSSSSLAAACVSEPWEPLRCVCRAYAEVVDAQIALLRTASASAVAPSIPGEGFADIGNTLDALLAKAGRVANGIRDEERGGAGASFGVAAEEGSEKAPERDTPLPKTAPQLPSSEGAGDATAGSQHPRHETPPSQAAGPETTRSGHSPNKHHTAFSLPLAENGERDTQAPSAACTTAPPRRESPGALSAKEYSHTTANAAATGSPPPPAGPQPTERFVPDPLDYFMTSRGVGETTWRSANVQGGAPGARNFLDILGAPPASAPHPMQGGDDNTFVAEFDPFA